MPNEVIHAGMHGGLNHGTKRQERVPDPCIVVIFGASGDLTKRKLLPALFHLKQEGLLPDSFAVVGVARRDISAKFAADMEDGILKGGGVEPDDPKLKKFMEHVEYFTTNFDDDAGFEKLKVFLADIDEKVGTKGNRLFYLAVAPEYFADITQRLGKAGLTKPEAPAWAHVIIEKPFGNDLASAIELIAALTEATKAAGLGCATAWTGRRWAWTSRSTGRSGCSGRR